jgi:GT2 family glycosyltransferase
MRNPRPGFTGPGFTPREGVRAYFTYVMQLEVTVIVVAYTDAGAAVRAVQSLREQSLAPIEVLVVDNDPAEATTRALAESEIPSNVRVITPGRNLGYTGAVNLAARHAAGDWLFLLNPDATAAADCLERLLEAVDGPDVAIVGAQVLLPDGRINAGENPVNIAGFSWSGGYGRPREHRPARDTAAVSGAALLVRRDAFADVGGLCPHFFMYVDDVDLAWRMRLRGMRVRYCPAAIVVHDYEFEKGPHKWFYLERNRLWALLSNLRLRTLALLCPLLLATEVVIFIHAWAEGWLKVKTRAWFSLFREFRPLIRWRRGVQATRAVSDYEVLELFSGGVQTDLLTFRLPRLVNVGLECYRRAVLALISKAR